MRKPKGCFLGLIEVEVLTVIVNHGMSASYCVIVKEICGENADERECRSRVTRALKNLRRKGLLYKKRYLGKVNYYLTKEARDLLNKLSLCP